MRIQTFIHAQPFLDAAGARLRSDGVKFGVMLSLARRLLDDARTKDLLVQSENSVEVTFKPAPIKE
jgi:hypothetical protein